MQDFDSWVAQTSSCNVSSEFVLVVRSTFSTLKSFPPDLCGEVSAWMLVHLLSMEKSGAIFCDLGQLSRELVSWLDLDIPDQHEVYQCLCQNYEAMWSCPGFISNKIDDATPLLQVGERFIYLRKNYLLEQKFWHVFTSSFLPNMSSDTLGVKLSEEEVVTLSQKILSFLPEGQVLSEPILQAVHIIHNTNFLILTGGPGTGKTWTLSVILRMLILQTRRHRPREPLRIILAAPTGRAQARMIESLNLAAQHSREEVDFPEIPKEGKTLHTLLNYSSRALDPKDPDLLYADIVAIDETSMLDLALFTRLLQALPSKTKLILMGDPDQLPSVEPGAVFTDMLARLQHSQRHLLAPHTVTLKISRRAQNPDLQRLAQATLQGDVDVFYDYFTPWQEKKSAGLQTSAVNFYDVTNLDFSQLILWLRQQYRLEDNLLNISFSARPNQLDEAELSRLSSIFHAFESLCILSARRDSHPLSVTELNKVLSKMPFGQTFFHGMPIIVEKNMKEHQLTNGQRGVVLQMGGQLLCCFRGRTIEEWITIPVNILSEHISTSYVMTIHKSQGSEFKHVIILLPDHSEMLMCRSLLFTAITRAKEKVTLLTSGKTLKNSLENTNIGSSCLSYLFAQEDPNKQKMPRNQKSMDVKKNGTQLSLFG